MGIALRKLCCCLSNDGVNDSDIIHHYIGEKNCWRQKHGYGTFMFSNGDMYEGCWKFDKMDGFGKYIFANGERRVYFYVKTFQNH